MWTTGWRCSSGLRADQALVLLKTKRVLGMGSFKKVFLVENKTTKCEFRSRFFQDALSQDFFGAVASFTKYRKCASQSTPVIKASAVWKRTSFIIL